MPYFPVDDNMSFHPKVLAAGNEAVGMWTRCGALAKKYTTGGFVSNETVDAVGNKRLATRLVNAGLWVAVEGGFQYHDWTQQAGNDDAAKEKERAAQARHRNAERQREWRERDKARNAGRNGVSKATVTGGPSPSPSPITGDVSKVPSSSVTRGQDETNESPARSVLAGLRIDPERLVKHINEHTGRTVTITGAMQIALDRLDRGANVEKPQAYVLGSVKNSWQEVQQFIDQNGLSA
ncbi:hypothetical protein AB0230_01930 [Microbacterium sp. NPDC089190]|uniref:hypothetical protein n=1 Tax=Microbacterium sp. NPDC089190 TaxID=3155063 RepID=UPI003450DAD7